MKSTTVLASVFVLLMSSLLSAEESKLGTYLHGTWIIQGKANGEQVQGTMTVRPAAGGETQIYRWTAKYPDEIRHGSGIGGIDPASGKVVEHGFAGDSHWTNTYEDVLGDSIGKTTGIRVGTVQGEEFKGEITVERTSMDRFVYKVVSEDEVVVDFVFERQGESKDGEEAFKAYAEFAIGGKWVSTVDGMEFVDTYESVLDGQFFRMTSNAEGDFPASVTFFGVDPVTKRFTSWGFAADGSVSTGTSRMVKDGVWAGQWKSVGPKGSITSRARVKKIDDNTVEYKILDQTTVGDLPEFPKVTTWHRK